MSWFGTGRRDAQVSAHPWETAKIFPTAQADRTTAVECPENNCVDNILSTRGSSYNEGGWRTGPTSLEFVVPLSVKEMKGFQLENNLQILN